MKNENIAPEKETEIEKHSYIVGIGASAGGLEALQSLLETLPSNTGFPYIVVQHLSPDYKSLLTEILSKYTDMPVIQVENGLQLKPNCVYVIKPRNNLTVSNGHLFLASQRPGELNMPIDIFFRSLAEEAKAQAIAIVLSGTGSDGTNGIKNIKENDGMIIVQSPESAKFDGMPKSALRTGLIDIQLNPEEIALELKHIAETALAGNFSSKTENQVDEELMNRIYYILKKVSKINFTHYKQSTILRRIERRMVLLHMNTLSMYVDYLFATPSEAKILSKEVLIGVTNFFRDLEYFECLKEKAIKQIVLRSSPDEPIRAWVAGCSTGEEAYSIAILFSEVMDSLKIKRDIKIFATDLDVEAVNFAGKGVYGENIIDSVSVTRLSRFFTHRNHSFTIKREIRKMIVFSPHNVFQDPPFGKLDLISCRNMLIYFQTILQNELFSIFHVSLKDGGYLFLGKSEAIGSYTEAYPVIDAAAKIFTHRSRVKVAGATKAPFVPLSNKDEFRGDSQIDLNDRISYERMDSSSKDAIETSMLEQFMPACLIVNNKNELVHTYGENSNYIHFPVGKVTMDLFDIITDALKIPVSTLLKEARQKQEMIQYQDISFQGEHKESVINLTAMPISKKISGASIYYALVISDSDKRGKISNIIPYEIDRVSSQHIIDLEQELRELQEKLNKSVSAQECVNEELQAANEELLTANEELQSSNEELQSVNEELYTVNSEYQIKLTELADMNDDITNFLASTLIGIIFVDNKFCIRRFTNYVTSEFNIVEQDIGRSLKIIAYHFKDIDLPEICDNVLRTLMADEREVSAKNKTYFMRVAPYRTLENKILGCVITFVDITTQKQGQVILQSTAELLSVAQKANDAKSDFLSRMSHEIRTPMNALSGLAEMGKQQIVKQELYGQKELLEILDKISETTDYMTSIVSDILDMSKIEHSEVELNNKPFILQEALEQVISMISPRITEAGLNFEVSIDQGLNNVYLGDKTRIQQILINFLTNAAKYTTKDGHVSFKAFIDKDYVENEAAICFVISDTGSGISKNFFPDLFKPFSRENKDAFYSASSMGLGLSIAYNLVKLMDGDVQVETEEGQGTTFTIHISLNFPTARDKLIAVASKRLNKPDKLSGCHVLIAEDNELNRRILGALLAKHNVTYKEACDGAEAIDIYTNSAPNTFSCVLMDMRMPKVNGIRATMGIRESGKEDAQTIPIIGVSADTFPEDIKKAKIAGMNDYITKPIDTERLFKTMQDLCLVN